MLSRGECGEGKGGFLTQADMSAFGRETGRESAQWNSGMLAARQKGDSKSLFWEEVGPASQGAWSGHTGAKKGE